jgi:peptidyl-prolyl cis-trans isomerase B (cyclophilin B)
MRAKSFLSLAALVLVLSASVSCNSVAGVSNDQLAVIETNYGRIIVDFFPQEAPKHVARFKELVGSGFYDGVRFHRLIRNQSGRTVAAQGGDPSTKNPDKTQWGVGDPGLSPVAAEASQRLKHTRGMISAARKPNDPDSFTCQFFILSGAEPALDGEYSIFARVIEGMNVVDSIVAAPTFRGTEQPMDAVVINKTYLISKDDLKTLARP